jgi:hypothetical protein
MLKRFLKQLRLITSPQGIRVGCGVLVAVFVVLLTTHVAHADDITPISIPGLATLVSDSLANFFYSFQTIASWLIYLAGALLNFSINLTMHIKEFVTATPAIYTVWKAIRDISGMFLIFALLYAAIMLITGLKKPNFGELIKNIVVAGVLINFSFFLTGLAIDVSNVVSIQLYNAIAPAQTLNGGTPTDKTGILNRYIEQGKADGGLSTIFMQSLGVTRLYNPDGSISSTGKNVAQATQQNPNNAWATPVKIILIGVTSIIIMITAALSFFLAALAFIVRFVILIFLLAFSPILFASFVVPEIGKYATMWKTQLKNQLVFMPVYLLLMYFALSVLTSSSIFQNGYAGNLTSNGGFLGDLMVLALNAVLVIVMLNAPLLGAMSVGAMVPKWADKFKAENIWKKVGGWTTQGGATAWRDTGGRVASRIAQNQTFQAYAGRSRAGQAALQATRAVAGNFNANLSSRTQAREQFAQSLNRQGASAYANRLAGSFESRRGRSVLHIIGRADRVGAARILTTRLNEVNADVNRLNGELNGIVNASNQVNPATGAAFGLAGLPLNQRQRHDLLTGNNVTGINPGGTDELGDAQTDLNSIRRQIAGFQTTTGATTRDTTRRNY